MDRTQFLKDTGTLLYLARKRHRIPQKKMAQDLHINPSRLCRIERGKEAYSAFFLFKMCCYLDMSFNIDVSYAATKWTCTDCKNRKTCVFAFDEYNINGDCLAIK